MIDLDGTTYLSSDELAERMDWHPVTPRKQRANGSSPIPFVKVGTTVLYRLADVEWFERARDGLR